MLLMETFYYAVRAYTKRQPKVGKTDQLYLGRSLDLLLDRAEEIRGRVKDGEISEGHIFISSCRR